MKYLESDVADDGVTARDVCREVDRVSRPDDESLYLEKHRKQMLRHLKNAGFVEMDNLRTREIFSFDCKNTLRVNALSDVVGEKNVE